MNALSPIRRIAFALALLGLTLAPLPGLAGPFEGSFDDLTSVSGSYGARSTRIHPAALAFEDELNGSSLMTVLNAAVKPNANDDYGLGVAYGPLGFQWERQGGVNNKYRFGGAVAVGAKWFLGHRFSLYRLSDPSLSYDSWDTGIQFRPNRFASFGFLINNWNRPPSGSTLVPAEFILGTTLKMARALDLSLDVRTLSGSSEFLKRFQNQVAARWTPLPGLHLLVGYHSVRQWQMGLQFDFDYGSLISNAVPNSGNRTFAFGMETSPIHQRTVLAMPMVLHVKLDSSLVEDGVPSGLFRSEKPSLLSILDKLRHVPAAGNIRSVLLEIESFPLGLAAAEELYEVLLALREQGIPVEAHLGQAGMKEYLIASAASKILMEPEGELRFLGVRAERYYLKGTLDKIGVEGQFLARGKYKSAPETFTRTESSGPSREVTWEELDRVETQVLGHLADARHITTSEWKQMHKTALYSSREALEAKLIDGILTLRIVKQKLESQLRLTEDVARRRTDLSLPDRIAVVVAEGNILQSRTTLLALGGQSQLTPETFQQKLRKAVRDERTKGIIIRVSSPGGEVMASQELADLVREARSDKTVVVSMGDVAASGGYFMSAPAEKIFADKLTLTGSIGVFLGKFQFAGLYKWLKLNKEVLTKAPYPGLFSEDRPWSAEEMKVLTQRLNSYYENFVRFVSKNRGLSFEKADSVAQGRVWLGDQAKTHRLADENGGLFSAGEYLAKRENLPSMEFWEVRTDSGFLPWGDGGLANTWARSQSDPLGKWLGEGPARDLLWMQSLERNPYLYLSPIQSLE